MRPTDLTMSVRQRRPACVLDPTLVLCHAHGATLALRLTRVMEPWLTRSFWQVIDASDLVLSRLPADAAAGRGSSPPSATALASWIALRERTDASSWPLRWIGDNLTESQLQDSAGAGVVGRYEALAEALQGRLLADPPSGAGRRGRPVWWNPLQLGGDAAALAGTLDAALVLSCLPADCDAPWPSQALSQAGLEPQRLEPVPADSLFAVERTLVREALAGAGLAGLAQQLPPLAVVQVVVPRMLSAAGTGGPDDDIEEADAPPDPWTDARAWWYRV